MTLTGGCGKRRIGEWMRREGRGAGEQMQRSGGKERSGGTHLVLRIRVCPLGQQQRGSLVVTIVTGPVQWGPALLREREGRGA